MAEIIRMPRLSDTMEEGVIVGWEKKVGDDVEPGDILAEIETDKATMEFESVFEGKLLHIEVESGSVPINGVIAVIGEEGEDWKTQLAGATSEGTAEPVAASEATAPAAPAAATSDTTQTEAAGDDTRVKASPLARSMAREAGVDLTAIRGTGDNGRIVRKDVEAALESRQVTPAAVQTPPKTETPVNRPVAFPVAGQDSAAWDELPVSQMRKTIARRLSESKFGAPHFYLTMEIDMGAATTWRKQINEVSPVKISFNDLIVKACAVSLRQHPMINASWMGDKIYRHNHVHIGVAVAVEDGLLVPVVKHTDIKTLSQINTEVKEMADRARVRKLQPEEMQGNTFTVSNLGMFGIEEFTAIINPPDSCILAVGGIVKKPVYDSNGDIVPAHRMKVTLSCDHRVVDGASGARFLQTLKEILENPIRLLV